MKMYFDFLACRSIANTLEGMVGGGKHALLSDFATISMTKVQLWQSESPPPLILKGVDRVLVSSEHPNLKKCSARYVSTVPCTSATMYFVRFITLQKCHSMATPPFEGDFGKIHRWVPSWCRIEPIFRPNRTLFIDTNSTNSRKIYPGTIVPGHPTLQLKALWNKHVERSLWSQRRKRGYQNTSIFRFEGPTLAVNISPAIHCYIDGQSLND